jgi:hypothetical protein
VIALHSNCGQPSAISLDCHEVVAREGDLTTEELGPESTKKTGIRTIESNGSETSDRYEQDPTTSETLAAIVNSYGGVWWTNELRVKSWHHETHRRNLRMTIVHWDGESCRGGCPVRENCVRLVRLVRHHGDSGGLRPLN